MQQPGLAENVRGGNQMGESYAPCKSLDRLWIISLCRLEASQQYLGLDPTCGKFEWE